MIAQLRGNVVRTEADCVVLDVSGVGYLVHVPAPLLARLEECAEEVVLLTHLVVREEELSLYGFTNPAELQLFRLLLGVGGVGPKVAMALLSVLGGDSLARALSASDTASLTKVPGVGPKLAQRLCLELSDRVAALAFERRVEEAAGERTPLENAAYEDAIEGLAALGYSRADARRAVERIFFDVPNRSDAAVVLNAALRYLTHGKSL